jgi:hypothetical protein
MKNLFDYSRLILIPMALFAVGCSSTQTKNNNTTAKVDPKEIQENLSSYMNRPVETEGKVARVIGPNSFVIQGSGDQNLLIVSETLRASPQLGEQAAGTAMPTILEGNDVQAKGVIRELMIDDISRVYGVDRKPVADVFSSQSIPVLEVAPNDIEVKSS